MTQGRFIAVVGPSGAGKDSVMGALARARPGLGLARRVITRPGTAGGEDFDGVDAAEFARRSSAGAFVLEWQAHGLRYAIPRSETARMAAGQDLLANLSRRVLTQAAAAFGRAFLVLEITAPPEVLARRLAARGRETPADIAARLDRARDPLPPGLPVLRIDNGGTLDRAVAQALAALYPPSGTRVTA